MTPRTPLAQHEARSTAGLARQADWLAYPLTVCVSGVSHGHTLLSTQGGGVQAHSIARGGCCHTVTITVLEHVVLLRHTESVLHAQLAPLLASVVTRQVHALTSTPTLPELLPVPGVHAHVSTEECSS